MRFPEHFRKAVSLGSEAFYVGASWPSVRDSHWEILLKARAVENQAYVFGVNRIGKDPYASYAGGSCIISPKGEVLASAFDKEMVISAEVNPEEVREWRKEFPVLVEGISSKKNELFGYTDTFKLINFEGDSSLIGEIVKVKVIDAKTWSLDGEIVK